MTTPAKALTKFFNTIRYSNVFQFPDTTVTDSMIFAYQQPQNDIKEAVAITNYTNPSGDKTTIHQWN